MFTRGRVAIDCSSMARRVRFFPLEAGDFRTWPDAVHDCLLSFLMGVAKP